ncbi:MAG: HAD family phosphatase [Candidatus Omnitrophota bacterium]|nr:HAD family phosphatase [Candidatus Omnitrophota bacterium]
MIKFHAILFDFDGVLAMTMEDNFEAWKAAVSDYGITIQPEDYYPLEGLRVYEIPERIFSKHAHKTPDPAEVVRKKEAYYLEHHRFALYPEVDALLDTLISKKVPIAVVTAALKDRLARSVPSGFLDKFNAVVTGDDTKQGKPAADPYLRGAEKLGIKPENCIVIENAPLGVESAKKAGAYCIALCTTMKEQYLTGADEVLASLAELRNSNAIKQLLNSSSE